MGMRLAVLIPDTHRPYHNRKAYNLMIKIMEDLKDQIDEIVILGDYADFYFCNSHGKSPDMLNTLVKEIVDVNEGLNELDHKFPEIKKVFLEGNHEFRLERYLASKAPDLFGLTSVEHILEFNRRTNWKFISYGHNQAHKVLGSKLYARHEPLASSAKATASKALCSLVYGHIHRIEESHIVGMDGTNHVSFSLGWLGDKRNESIYGYVKSHHQWQMGFGLVWVDEKTGYFYHEKIHILDNMTAVVNGKLYKG